MDTLVDTLGTESFAVLGPLEYNVVRWGRTELRPEAGLAVYARSATGKLASARIYDDADPPLGPEP